MITYLCRHYIKTTTITITTTLILITTISHRAQWRHSVTSMRVLVKPRQHNVCKWYSHCNCALCPGAPQRKCVPLYRHIPLSPRYAAPMIAVLLKRTKCVCWRTCLLAVVSSELVQWLVRLSELFFEPLGLWIRRRSTWEDLLLLLLLPLPVL